LLTKQKKINVLCSSPTSKDHYVKEHGGLLGLGLGLTGLGSGALGLGMGADELSASSLEQYALYSQALLNAQKEFMATQQQQQNDVSGAQQLLQKQLAQLASSSSSAGKSGDGGGGGGAENDGGSHQCSDCSASFKTKEMLSIHKFQEHGAKDSLMKL
jgi:hypothetical protein